MADFLDEGEFWLPPKFLADDEGHTYAGSPSASDLGETESDDDDLLADLTRKMTRSALHNSGYAPSVRSPQSTLRPATWDLLCEAATEVAKMRLAEELYGPHTSVPYHRQLLLDYQIQQLKRHQMIKQQLLKPQNAPYAAAAAATLKHGRQVGLSPTAWPSLQQASKPSSAMRPVFVGPPAAGKRECAGTGVFLPRRAGSQPPEPPRINPAGSTALLSTEAVNALNMETVATPLHLHRSFNGGDVEWTIRRNVQQNRSIPAQAKVSSEIRLPQEWTY